MELDKTRVTTKQNLKKRVLWENDKRNRKNTTEKKKALWASYWAQLHVPGQEFHLEMVFRKWNELMWNCTLQYYLK